MSSGLRWLRSPKSEMPIYMDSDTMLPDFDSLRRSFTFLISSGALPSFAIAQTPDRALFTVLSLSCRSVEGFGRRTFTASSVICEPWSN